MKKSTITASFTFIMLHIVSIAQIVNMPDANFKAALVADYSINTNLDNEIQLSEASTYTNAISVSSMSITSLAGIEMFTAITSLNCSDNQLSSLNVSANTALHSLDCGFNQLTTLNASANTTLVNLSCSANQITSLTIPASATLDSLSCGQNQLTNLDVSANTGLTYLNCNINQLTSLNISSNSALIKLGCAYNQLTNLNVSNNTALTELYCFSNQLTSLDVSLNTHLDLLWCYFNQLTSLDVTVNSSLVNLKCQSNSLTSLNVKNGNNINFNAFDATSNPNLQCIVVDDASYSTANWTSIDGSQSFVTAIIPTPTPTITQNGDVLTSSAIDGNQWYLDNVFTGVTTPTYTVTENGNYQVKVIGLCDSSSLSSPVDITSFGTGLEQNSVDNAISLYPNPNNGRFEINSATKILSTEIINKMGVVVLLQKIDANSATIDGFRAEQGVYFVRIITASGIVTKKIIID